MKIVLRPLVLAASLTIISATATANPTTASAGSVFTETSLTASAVNSSVTASVTIAATVRTQAVLAGICVRNSAHANHDFTFDANVTIGSAGRSITRTQSLAAGSYTYWGCVKTGTYWNDLAPIKSVTVTVTAASTPPNSPVLTPEMYGAAGDGVTDDTAAVQRALDAVPGGATLLFGAGKVYRHTDVLLARVAGEHLTGTGVLLATNEARSSFWIAANNVLVDGGLTFRMGPTTQRWDAYEQMGIRLAGVSGTTLRNIKVEGSAAAGIYIGRSCCISPTTASSGFLLEDVSVSNTRADGIHMTGGSHDGVVRRAVTTSTGDDGIAVVSYENDGAITNHISIQSPTVRGTIWARGLSVVGGEDISYTNVHVDSSNAAAIYLSVEGAPYYTYGTKRVTVIGGYLNRANTNTNTGHGAILLYSARPGFAVADITLDGLTITDTRMSAPWQVGLLTNNGAGSITGAMLRNISVVRGGPLFFSQAPGTSYSTVNWTVDGISRPDHLA